MADTVVVQLRFELPAQGHYPPFADALLFASIAEYEAATGPEIAVAKAARYAAWQVQYDQAISGEPTGMPSISDLQAALLAIYGSWQTVQRIAGVSEGIPLIATEPSAGMVDIQTTLAEHGCFISVSDLVKIVS